MDLSLIPTETLVKEIEARSDASIVAYERVHPRDHLVWFYYHGGVSRCLGLLVRFNRRLLSHDEEIDEEPAS
jgi:hypothetical protein